MDYAVLLPDIFYRYGFYGPFDPVQFRKGAYRAVLGPLMATTSNAKTAQDTEVLLAFLDMRRDVEGRKVGAVGFYMGVGIAITAAGTYPDRFVAAASFHGGNLATDAPDGPHTYALRLKARLTIAAATDDASYKPDLPARLETVFERGGRSTFAPRQTLAATAG